MMSVAKHQVCVGELAQKLEELVEEENTWVVLVTNALVEAAQIYFIQVGE